VSAHSPGILAEDVVEGRILCQQHKTFEILKEEKES
jgi:hypothetical protein